MLLPIGPHRSILFEAGLAEFSVGETVGVWHGGDRTYGEEGVRAFVGAQKLVLILPDWEGTKVLHLWPFTHGQEPAFAVTAYESLLRRRAYKASSKDLIALGVERQLLQMEQDIATVRGHDQGLCGPSR